MGMLPNNFSYAPTPYGVVILVFQYRQNEKKDKVAKDYISRRLLNVHLNMVVAEVRT